MQLSIINCISVDSNSKSLQLARVAAVIRSRKTLTCSMPFTSHLSENDGGHPPVQRECVGGNAAVLHHGCVRDRAPSPAAMHALAVQSHVQVGGRVNQPTTTR